MDTTKRKDLEEAYRKKKDSRVILRMVALYVVRVRKMSIGETAASIMRFNRWAHTEMREVQQPPEPHLVRGACPVGQKLCGHGTPREHNHAGRHADEGDPDRVCPDPHSARAKLVRHEGIHQDWTKEGQRKDRSGRGRQDAARRLPDPQGEKKIP